MRASSIVFIIALGLVALLTPLSRESDISPTSVSFETSQSGTSPSPEAHLAVAALEVPVAKAQVATPDLPSSLVIPAIGLNSKVIPMGINSVGELDVPDGKSSDVGWYEGGTVPGEMGSAVMDAHVYAAFSKLRYVKVGSDIYIETVSGEKLHFTVVESMLYPYDQVPPHFLFERSDGKRLNLITCAGKYLSAKGTYDKRLVAYAVLAE